MFGNGESGPQEEMLGINNHDLDRDEEVVEGRQELVKEPNLKTTFDNATKFARSLVESNKEKPDNA